MNGKLLTESEDNVGNSPTMVNESSHWSKNHTSDELYFKNTWCMIVPWVKQ